MVWNSFCCISINFKLSGTFSNKYLFPLSQVYKLDMALLGLTGIRLNSRQLVEFKPTPYICSFPLDQWLLGTSSSHGGSLEIKWVSRNIRCLLRSFWPETDTLVTLAHISLTKTNYKAKCIITWGERKCPLPPLMGEMKKSYDKDMYVEFQYRKVMKH